MATTKPAIKANSNSSYPKSDTAKCRDMAAMGKIMQQRVTKPAAAKKR